MKFDLLNYTLLWYFKQVVMVFKTRRVSHPPHLVHKSIFFAFLLKRCPYRPCLLFATPVCACLCVSARRQVQRTGRPPCLHIKSIILNSPSTSMPPINPPLTGWGQAHRGGDTQCYTGAVLSQNRAYGSVHGSVRQKISSSKSKSCFQRDPSAYGHFYKRLPRPLNCFSEYALNRGRHIGKASAHTQRIHIGRI